MRRAEKAGARRRIGWKHRAVLASAVILIVLAVMLFWNPWRAEAPTETAGPQTEATATTTQTPERVMRALVYDSLYREFPNDELLRNITETLRRAGYTVDVYVGVNATLDPLVALHRYGLVIIRAHGAYNGDPESGRPLGAYIYTGLHYAEAKALYGDYIDESLENGDLALGVIPPPGQPLTKELLKKLPRYVTVSPRFFKKQLSKLPGTVVVFAGCYGLDDDRLGEVFVSKGASAFISWKGNITWTHMDRVLRVLVAALARGDDPAAALSLAMRTVGPDPVTHSVLEMVPSQGAGV